MAYYNELDPVAASWLRELIKAGHIAPGDVDERSIEDVHPSDLRGYAQCHFFAGIGGWSHALRLAGWPDDRPIWTGSCPCQPFSTAGKGGGFADERHLWPAWHHLIRECGPAVVFGEQVASGAAGQWLDLVQDDLEGMGYAFGAVPFPAAGVGAPHIRDRLYWVADSDQRIGEQRCAHIRGGIDRGNAQSWPGLSGGGVLGGLANTKRLQSTEPTRQRNGPGAPIGAGQASQHSGCGAISDARSASPLRGHWGDADWLFCRDDKWRPVEPGTFPLADGLPARVGRLRGYGNAIVPQAAQEFIVAYLDSMAA